MGSEGTNYLVTLFLISNAFNGFGFGLFLFAFGVGSSTLAEVTTGFTVCIVVGLIIICLSIIGTCGAIAQNTKKLITYTSAMIILVVAEVVHLVVVNNSPLRRSEDVLFRIYFVSTIFNIVITIVSILLASVMLYGIKSKHVGSDHCEASYSPCLGHPRTSLRQPRSQI